MLLDIALVKSSSMFCFESAAASFAAWRNRNYEMMFCKMWGFDFLPAQSDPRLIGERIKACFSLDDMCQLLEKFHGISVTRERISSHFFPKKKIIRNLRNNIPLLLSFSERISFFIIGYDAGELLLLDIHYNSRELLKITFRDLYGILESGKIKYMYFYTFHTSGVEKKDPTINDFLEMFKLKDNLKEDVFSGMRNLAAATKENLNLPLEKQQDKSLYWMPLLVNITHLSRARRLISSALDYIRRSSYDNIAYNMSNRFIQAAIEWNTVWNIINKAFYVPDQIDKLKKKISDRIYRIADLEEQLILNIVNNRGFDSACYVKRETSKTVPRNHAAAFRDISEYYNNKALASDDKNTGNSSFTGNGDFIIIRDFVNKEWQTNAALFKPELKNGYDNIICSGQVIPVAEKKYSRIMFVGCSVWGSQSGLFKVLYTDGYAEKDLLSFPDFLQKDFADVAAVCTGVYHAGNTKQDITMFAISFSLEYNNALASIQLPDEKNIHLFALALS